MSNSENLDPYEPYVDPDGGENLDPNTQLAEGSYVLPDYAKGYGAGEAALVGMGRGFTKFGRGVEDLSMAAARLLGNESTAEKYKKKRAELAKKTAEENKFWEEGLANKQSGVSGWAKGGEFAGEVLPSFAIPGSAQKTLVRRALDNAARQGVFNAATTQGNVVDRAGAGGTGAVGGGLGSAAGDVIAKGFAGAMGRWGDDAIKQMNDKLVQMGLKPRVGDLAGSEEATLTRSMENWASHTPVGSKDFKAQQNKLAELITPGDAGRNVLTDAVIATDKGISKTATDIWRPFDTFASKHPNLPKVPPHNLREALLGITKHDEDFLNKIPDEVIRKQLINLVGTPKNKVGWIPMSEYNELRKALGSMTPSIKAISTPAIGSTKIVDKKLPTRFANVIDGISKDMDQWGTFTGVGNGKELFDNAMNRWKQEVLPWKNSTIAPKLRDVTDFGSSDTAKIIGNEGDLKRLGNVQKYLRKYSDPNDADVMDALVTMQRASHALGLPVDETVNSGSLLSGILAPTLLSGVAATTKASSSPIGKAMYFGDSVPVMTSPVMRGYLGASGEVGEDELSGLLVIKELLEKAQGSFGDRSIGSLTESGAAAGQSGERK